MSDAQDKFDLIRGRVLAYTYDIESKLDSLIIDYFFPSSTTDGDRVQAFADYFLSLMILERKIKVVASICKALGLDPSAISRNGKLLNEVREVRNGMAHSPISLTPVKGQKGVQWRVTLHYRNQAPLVIDQAKIDEWNKLFIDALNVADQLLKHLLALSPAR